MPLVRISHYIIICYDASPKLGSVPFNGDATEQAKEKLRAWQKAQRTQDEHERDSSVL